MHPIERLRYIARDGYLPTEAIVEEVVTAFAHLVDEPAGLTSLRRVLVRQGWCGPLWWAAARVLTAPDGYSECREVLGELASDTTPDELCALLSSQRVGVLGWTEQAALALVNSPDISITVFDAAGEGNAAARQLAAYGANVLDVVSGRDMAAAMEAVEVLLVDSALTGPHEFLAPAGSGGVLAAAADAGVQRWLIAGVGRRLPAWLYERASEHAIGCAPRPSERVPATLVDRLVCEVGSLRAPPIVASPRFPKALELVFPVET